MKPLRFDGVPPIKPSVPVTKRAVEEMGLVGGEPVLIQRVGREVHLAVMLNKRESPR